MGGEQAPLLASRANAAAATYSNLDASERPIRKSVFSRANVIRPLLAAVAVTAIVGAVVFTRGDAPLSAAGEGDGSTDLGYKFGPGALMHQEFYSDNNVPEGACDQEACPGVSFVANCLGGGAGCVGTESGCRMCTTNPAAVGQYPDWLPACPCCICTLYNLPPENCVRRNGGGKCPTGAPAKPPAEPHPKSEKKNTELPEAIPEERDVEEPEPAPEPEVFEELGGAAEPAPSVDAEEAPAPSVDAEEAPAPSVDAEEASAPSVDAEEAPAPSVDAEEAPAPSVEA